ncbi:MAG: flagellar basal body L-ring protein FlgH [Pseudomonadota bacterium]
MTTLLDRLLCSVWLVLLTGCVIAPPPQRPEPSYEPVYSPSPAAVPNTQGSIFNATAFNGLFTDRRALGVGDIVTIRLEEQTTSQKSAETTMRKEADVELPNPKVLGSLVRGTGSELFNDIANDSQFSGGAESDQSNSLFGTITAIIAEVYPNGLMRVRGEKWMNLNRGEEYLRVSGLLRPQDIDDDNSVSSVRLADARIAYSGTGSFADTNAAGWLTRFFMNPKYPF